MEKIQELQQRLSGHSPQYIDMALKTDMCCQIENADGYGKRTGECGDTVEMFITVSKNDIIDKIRFIIEGCLNTNACANTLVYLVQGKRINEAWNISPDHITDYLQTLPKHETHCAELACGAFYLALKNAQDHQLNPWKKNYCQKT